MSDETVVTELIGKAWDETDLTQTHFAAILRNEADLYEEAPESASSPHRQI